MKYNKLIFDLDGTLIDSGEGITNAVKYALEKLNMEIPDWEVLRSFIGPPLTNRFMELYGFTVEESKQAVVYFQEYYKTKGLYETSLYPGIKEMLSGLREHGIRLMIATSKPERFARKIALNLGIDTYFEYIGGSCEDGIRDSKQEVLEYVLEHCSVTEEEYGEVLMVGDRKYDVEGARVFGIQTMGVSYGFGTAEELNEAGAIEIAATTGEVLQKVIG